MLRFQPPDFKKKVVLTRLGQTVYYTSVLDVPVQRPVRSPLLFLHSFGGGASAYEWSQVYPAFASTHQIIAPELIGWGASDHPRRRYKLQDYIENIQAVIEQVATEPVVAVASLLSAALVVRLAAAQPQLFSRLFLVCPSGFQDFGRPAGRRLPEPLINLPGLDQAIYALGATNELAVRNFLENFLFSRRDRLSPETVAAYLYSAQQPNADCAALSFLRGDLYFDLAPDLKQLMVPTAIVWGEAAQFVPVLLGQQLAALNPEAVQQFQVISDTGVLPHLEQPATVTARLVDWLRPNSDG